MKRIGMLFLWAGLLLPASLAAQRQIVVDSLGRRYVLKPLPHRDSFRPQHELRVQYGLLPILGSREWGLFGGCNEDCMPFPEMGVRYGEERSTDAFAVAYNYRITPILEAGGVFSYAGFYRNRYATESGAVTGRYRDHYYTLMATVRLSWLNRPWIRMYSSLSLGAQWERERLYDGEKYGHSGMTGQLSLLGLSVGRRFFGFVEVGFGALGTTIFGVGYRFDAAAERR